MAAAGLTSLRVIDWPALDERWLDLVSRSEAESVRSGLLTVAAVERRAKATVLRSASFAGRAASRSHLRCFRLRGVVGTFPVTAVLRGTEVLADVILLQRAALLVQLGDYFETPDRPAIAASLVAPIEAVILTLVRACDRVLDVELGPAPFPGD